MPKNKLRHVDFVLSVNYNWDSLPVVHYCNVPFLLVDLHSKLVHFLVSLVIITRIHQHFIKNLVKTRRVTYLFEAKSHLILRQNPFTLFCRLYCPNVRVRSQKDVLQWGFLLINLFHCLVLLHNPVKFKFILKIQYFIIWLTLIKVFLILSI